MTGGVSGQELPEYSKPALVVVGTVAELTQASGIGLKDALLSGSLIG